MASPLQMRNLLSPFSTLEHFQKILYELMLQLSKCPASEQEAANVENNIHILTNHVEQIVEKRLEEFGKNEQTDDEFEDEWIVLAWGLLNSLTRLPAADRETTTTFNHLLVRLVNGARPMRIPAVCPEAKTSWNQFHELYNSSLHYLHGLYSQLDNPNCNIELKMRAFFSRQLEPCLHAFRRMCFENANGFQSRLRRKQVTRMSRQEKVTEEDYAEIKRYYATLAYTLGLLAVRIQGFRYECQTSTNNHYATPETLWTLLNEVFLTYEHVMNDALMCNEPCNSPIMVTNNLFTFTCATLCRTLLFRCFDIQIVSEETAGAIQSEIVQCRSGAAHPRETSSFPSAALIAMKPTTGVKRNNATANQKGTGGNTAHKKSDVNSQEFVTIPPTYSDSAHAWQTTYPHLLCTTRQKDAVLLDSKTTATGKRPLFYFYIKAKTWSPTGEFFFVRTLSLPFTISTRRNQDCQVQRMNSSYTATCFWMYGTCSINGLLLNWNETPLTWSQFKTLTGQYFMVSGEVARSMEESDYALLANKMHCSQCVEEPPTTELAEQHRPPSPQRDASKDGERISFKNMLCSHLRFETETLQMKFSVWRGLLEVLQIFQDPKANVKVLWENYLMHGFLETQAVVDLLSGRHNCMVIRLTFILGGSVCVSYRNLCGDVVHLEPLELKKLQAKSCLEYIADIAETAKIDYLLTYHLEYMPVSSVVEKFFPQDEVKRVRGVVSNVADKGPLDLVTHVKFTPLRVAVVACREQTPRPSPRPPEAESPDVLFLHPTLPTRRFHQNSSDDERRLENQNLDPLLMMTPSTSSDFPHHHEHPHHHHHHHLQHLQNPLMASPSEGGSFELQLEALMKMYGKTPQDVLETVSYAARPAPPPIRSPPLMAPPTVDDSFDDLMMGDYLSLDFPTSHFLRV